MTALRQVRFPLKIKLLSLMIIMIASSLIVFVGIALRTFKEDKSAYIFETLLNKAASGQVILSQKLLTETNPEVISVETNKAFEVAEGKLFFAKSDPTEILKNELDQESTYDLKIIVPHQADFYEWKKNQLSLVSEREKEILAPILSKSINQGVKEVELDGKRILYAYDYNPATNYAYVVSLSVEKAYAVTTYLIHKSIYYGLFILGIAMLLSVLLARPLTAQLETLFGMTQEIAKGNFTQRVALSGHDEVGALSDSINDMADKIVAYMDEMKEKARLENEVAVAQLVQSSFFPQGHVSDPTFDIFGHFEPATECGGDWWGISDHGDWRIFFIADATGHGVPAALLTATINCCKTSLGFIAETRPEFISQPQEILRYMNQAVCGAGKEIQVTCFVATFNRKTREFAYSNASHTPPLLYSGSTEALTKENFQPLIEANGPRLGQKLEATFISQGLKLNTYDTIFFYTDGLTEAENAEGTAWGQRRLIKSLLQHGKGRPEEIIQGVLADFKGHTSQKLEDDLTAVVLKVIA